MTSRIKGLLSIRNNDPLIIGHRGLSWEYPENTMVSFQAAAEAGADLIELDFRTTADAVLVCAHDETISRYLNKTDSAPWHGRAFSSFTWNELCDIDVGTWKNTRFSDARVPRLSDVLATFATQTANATGPVLLMERKTGTPEQTLDLLRQFDAADRVIVQSFDWAYLAQLHALAPTVPIVAVGGGEITPGRIDDLLKTGTSVVHWSEHVRAADVKCLHQQGLAVWTYTLNSELAHCGAQFLGIDGITTDRCNLSRQFLQPQS